MTAQAAQTPGRAKPVRYSQAIILKVCRLISEGNSLRTVCKRKGMPHIGTFLQWANDRPDVAEQYARAREARADMLAEDMIHIADTPQIGVVKTTGPKGTEIKEGDMLEHRKLRVDVRKWNAARMAPKKYGDKQDITHKGDPLAPVQLVLNGSDVHG